MSTSVKNFVIKNGATIGNVIIDAASNTVFANTGNVQAANIIATSFANLGNASNVYIGGGSSGYVLQTDGLGNLTWTSSPDVTQIQNGNSNVSVPVANGNVYINATSAEQWVFDTTGNLTAPSTGTANLGNYVVANFANFASNVTAGNANVTTLLTTGNANVTANLTASNANVTTLLTAANANVTSNLTASNANVTTLLTAANANVTSFTAGNANVTSNLTTSNANVTTLLTALAANVTNDITVGGNANVTGNVSANNANVTVLLTAGNANVTSQLNAGNANVTSNLTTSNANVTTLLTAANANVTLVTAGNIYANAGAIVANLLGGTLNSTSSAQPNITSVGTLANLTVSGNIQTNSDLLANTVSSVSGPILVTTTTNGDINLHPNGTGNVDVANTYITNLALTPINPGDAASKSYVDATTQGLSPKDASDYATTTALPAYTYNNGTSGVGATITANVNGALTIDGGSPTTGMRVLIKNETGGNQPYNGIYVVTAAGSVSSPFILTRSSDFDLSSPSSEIPGAFTFVIYGTSNANTGWICTTLPPVTVGTTNITFTQFSAAGEYSAGTGITITGTVINISNTSVSAGSYGGGDQVATFTVNDQGQLTSASNAYITANAANLTGTSINSSVVTSSLTAVGTLASLDVTGNITSDSGYILATNIGNSATYLAGDGSNITNVTAASMDAGNLTGSTLSSNVTSSSLTAVGVLASLEVNGNITSDTGTITAGTIGSLSTYLIGDGSNISNVSAEFVAAANLTGSALSSNVVSSSLTAVGTLAGLTATGIVDFTSTTNVDMSGSSNVELGDVGNVHITGGMPNQYLQTDGSGSLSWSTINTSSISNGSSNVSIPLSNGPVIVGVSGTANVLYVASTGANINGSLNVANAGSGNITSDNANLGNVVTANYANINSNVFVGNSTSNVSLANGNVTLTGNVFAGNNSSNVSIANGNITLTGNVTTDYVAYAGGAISNRSNVSVSTTATMIDQFAPSAFRTAKYVISASSANGYQSVETLLIQDGVSEAYITIYGSICTNDTADIIDITANISGVTGNVTVYATANSSVVTSANVNVVATYINT